LAEAIEVQNTWRFAFDAAMAAKSKNVMRECARNHKALEGVIKTLRWTLEYAGVGSPLQ